MKSILMIVTIFLSLSVNAYELCYERANVRAIPHLALQDSICIKDHKLNIPAFSNEGTLQLTLTSILAKNDAPDIQLEIPVRVKTIRASNYVRYVVSGGKNISTFESDVSDSFETIDFLISYDIKPNGDMNTLPEISIAWKRSYYYDEGNQEQEVSVPYLLD